MSIIGRNLDIINTEPWTDLALCKEIGPDDQTWYPEKGHHSDARKICARCEVRQECLDYALSKPEPAGIWGGKSARERMRLRRAS